MQLTGAEVESSIPARFERIVRRYGSLPAVLGPGGEYTYAELNRQANRVAHTVLAACGEGPEPIVIFCRHDLSIIAAILGVLKAGRGYVCLDQAYSAERCRQILEDLGATTIVTDRDHIDFAQGLIRSDGTVLSIEDIDVHTSDNNPTLPLSPDALLGVFYTSGTTGKPRGIVRDHRFLLRRVWLEANDYRIGPGDRFSLIHACSFNASLADIFDALLTGAKLCLFDIRAEGVQTFIPWLAEQRITFFHAPSAFFRQFLYALETEHFFPDLRQITPSGRLYAQDVRRMRQHVGEHCILIQRLSSTETGMITRLMIDSRMEFDAEVVPVGYPVHDNEILIVDEAGEPLDHGEVGEIVVKSRYLSCGYWNQPALEQEKYLPDPDDATKRIFRLRDTGRLQADGCLELVGRKDFQLKVRGYRVEPGEVEAALLAIPGVREAVVLGKEDAISDKRLVAYIVPHERAALTASGLRSALAPALADYMLPSAYIFMDQLPLTERGKVDRRALPDPDGTRPQLDVAYGAPQTPAERKLAAIWSEALGIEPVGIDDNFFDLGGHSLLAARVLAQIDSELGVTFPLRTLFDRPTVKLLAEYLRDAQPPAKEPSPDAKIGLSDKLRMLGIG